MIVKDAMSTNPVSLTEDASFKELWSLFFKRHFNAIPVTDGKKKVIGIVTKDDLMKRLYPNQAQYIADFIPAKSVSQLEENVRGMKDMKAREIMNRRVIFTREKTQLMRALSRMIVRRVDQLPVLSDSNKLVGMITRGDIFRALFRQNGKLL